MSCNKSSSRKYGANSAFQLFMWNKEPKKSILFLNLFLWILRKLIKLHLNNNNQNIYSIFHVPSKTTSAVCTKLQFSSPYTATKPKTIPHSLYCSLLPCALPTNTTTLPQSERTKYMDVHLCKELSPGSILMSLMILGQYKIFAAQWLQVFPVWHTTCWSW